MISIDDSKSDCRNSLATEEPKWEGFWQQRPFRVVASWGRGVAVFLGVFTLLNIAGKIRYPGFDANIWWIDFRFVSGWISQPILGAAAVFMLAFAVRPVLSPWRRKVTLVLTIVLYVVCIWNVVVFYVLLGKGEIEAAVWVPFSLFVSMAMEVVGIACVVRRPVKGWRLEYVTTFVVLGFCTFAFPVAQMFCFGKTDYRRGADVIIVFGARVYDDGRLSDALADRVRTGCALYKEGFAGKIIFSGGPGDGEIHETEGMKRAAIRQGVPEEAIVLDAGGVNTQATVENTTRMFEEMGMGRVLAVSHFYHLPRIKMTYQQRGWDVFTVPAEESYLLTAMPKYMLREVAALWIYYLRPLSPKVFFDPEH